jgi:dipeptidyl aminopeptidase/acylaminoacyl peptidase
VTEPSVVTYRGRTIDLAPYLEGFPFSGFDSLPEANLLLYMHDLPDRRLLKAQPLDRPFDPALGRPLGDHDWNRRSFFGANEYWRAADAILLLSDESNDEVLNVYALALGSAALTRLTDVPYVHGYALSPDGSRLAYVARYADGPKLRAELRMREMASGQDGLVVADTPELRFTWGKLLWSHGGDHLLVPINLNEDRNRSNLVWVDLAAPALSPLLDVTAERSVLAVLDDWAEPDVGLIVSNESGYMQLYRLDTRDGASVRLTDRPSDFRSVRTVTVGERVLVASVDDRPQDSPMRLLDPRTGATLWEHVEVGSVFLMQSGADRLYGWSTSLAERWAMWRLEVGPDGRRPDGVAVRWERAAAMPRPVVEATSHALVERIEYPTFDIDPRTGQQRRIHAFLLLSRDRPPAVEQQAFVLAFYGGHDTYNQSFQILAQAGFIVLSPAVRGSFGFGREFYSLIDHDLGGDEMLDLIYGARYLQARFGLAPRRIGVFGASHGGYATVRALTLPRPIKGRDESFDWGFGWAHAGFYDITTFWRDCNIPDWVAQKAGDPRTERERLLDRSPLTHAERLRAPLYLTHGERDNRVPVAESRALAARLRELGRGFAYDEFAGHGHSLKGIAAQRRQWQGLLAYLEQATAADRSADPSP